MRRFAALLLCALLPALAGCNSIYSNYREIENLLVVRTVGFDRAGSGTRFSLASSSSDGGSPIRMSADGASISEAMEKIRNYSSQEDVFYPHVEHILLGEDAAAAGIVDYISFFCRSPELRIDIPIYIVKGDTAEQALLSTGNETRGISEILQTEQARLAVSGDSGLFSTVEIFNSLSRSGAALVCALKCEPSAESAAGEDMLTVIADGYAIIRGGALCGYIEQDISPAVRMLLGDMGITELTVDGPDGDPVTLQLNHCSSRLKPRWDGDALIGFDVSVDVSASVNESDRPLGLADPARGEKLRAALDARVKELVCEVFALSQRLNADFLGLRYLAELDSPKRYYAFSDDFAAAFPALEINVSTSSRISHTNNISNG